MNDHGYTLTEMLVALVMVGLAMSGMSLAARSVAHAERRVRGQHDVGLQLDRLRNSVGADLIDNGPYPTADQGHATLRGDNRSARFDCQAARCELALEGAPGRQAAVVADGKAHPTFSLAGLPALALSYVSALDGRLTDAWPPADRSDRLAAIVLTNLATPVLVLPTPVQQPPNCVFDASLHRCRPASPS